MNTDSTDSRFRARERISALLDAELEEHDCERAFRELAADESLCGTWERYHLIGACLRRERVTLQPELTTRLAERLKTEPDRVTGTLTTRVDKGSQRSRVLLPLALAASVAVLVAGGVAIQGLWLTPRDAEVAASAAGTPKVTRWNTADPDHEVTLNTFLVEHSEFTSQPGMNGLASYAKFLSYDTAR